jgi:predicted metal-dependent HD superfamily phosphohydrolase
MAVWFHDVIYEIAGVENELKSAAYFHNQSDKVMTPEFRQKVYNMILNTIHDKYVPEGDACYVVDVDLSSLGMSWDCFKKDSDAIRKENFHLSDEEFVANQCSFLQALLDRPKIFFTDFYGKLYESPARANIQRQLDLCQ